VLPAVKVEQAKQKAKTDFENLPFCLKITLSGSNLKG
jgi:hypothetical protein